MSCRIRRASRAGLVGLSCPGLVWWVLLSRAGLVGDELSRVGLVGLAVQGWSGRSGCPGLVWWVWVSRAGLVGLSCPGLVWWV